MRAVVLSDDRIINYLNENYVNTWVRTFELRNMRETSGYQQTHSLTWTIIDHKWRRGPVDAWIISQDLETMGHVPVNEYLGENRREDVLLKVIITYCFSKIPYQVNYQD